MLSTLRLCLLLCAAPALLSGCLFLSDSAATSDPPLTIAEDMGADGYGKDAIECVDLAKELLGIAVAGAVPTDPSE